MELIIDSFHAETQNYVDAISAKSPVLEPTPFGKISGRPYTRHVSARERGETREKIGHLLKSNLRPHTLRRDTSNHYTTEELEIHIPFRGVMFLSVK